MAVESTRCPYLPVTFTLRDLGHTVEALLDTGFDGDVAVPAALIGNSGPPDSFKLWVLADGSRVRAAVYAGTAQVGELPPMPVDIIALGSELIIGRGVTDLYRIILDRGQRVIVEP